MAEKKIKPKAKLKAKINVTPEIEKIDTLTETNESVFIQEIETQDDFSNPFENMIENKIESKRRPLSFYIPWILLIIFSLTSFYFWSQLSNIRSTSLKEAKVENDEIISSVGRIIVLPSGETPQITTLTAEDIGKMKNQSFFMNANVDDKVLAYTIARKVILYRPNINKIIEVANLSSDNVPKP